MPDLTSPDTPVVAPPEPSEVPFAHLWASTDGTKQSALAGMVADKPELRDAQLTPDQWRDALTAYLESPRP